MTSIYKQNIGADIFGELGASATNQTNAIETQYEAVAAIFMMPNDDTITSIGFMNASVNGTATAATDSRTGAPPPTTTAAPNQTAPATPTNTTAATGITVSTNSDKTGYSLTATTGLGNQTADITGNLSGSVNSVTAAVTVTGTVNADVKKINAVTIIGDGSGTPFTV